MVLLCSFSKNKREKEKKKAISPLGELPWTERLPLTRGNITTASLNAKISFMFKNKNYMNINILLYDYTAYAYLSWFIHMHLFLYFNKIHLLHLTSAFHS